MRILNIITDTIVDGPGFRTSVYMAGCDHKCPGCHNKESWDFSGGYWMSEDDLYETIMSSENDVTFSGGDPMYQATSLVSLLKRLKESGKNIWLYTGFTFEELIDGMETSMALRFVDVVVDGPFISYLKDDKLLFRGSSNQRIVDVARSLRNNKIVELYIDIVPRFQ